MEAKHPVTGAPIRILRTGVQLWKDAHRLYWLTDPTRTTLKCDTFATNLSVANEAEHITFLALMNPDEPNLYEFLNSPQAQEYVILILTKEIIQNDDFPKGLKNILCLEEIPQIYSHISTQFDGSEKSVAQMISEAFRYIELITDPPQQLWLITQYYESSRRRKEIQYCLKKNLENPLIDKVVLLNDKIYQNLPQASTKLEQVDIHRRLHYSDVLKYIYETVPKNTIVVFANSDIFFDTTLNHLWSIDLNKKFLALLRYDIKMDETDLTKAIIFGPRPDSQDAWVIQSDSVKGSPPESLSNFEFAFGRPGCDNAVAYEMLRQKFLVANPAQTIRTYHVHESNYRTYSNKDVVEKSVFLYMEPTPIQQFAAEPPPKSKAQRTHTYKGYTPNPQFISDKAKAIFLETLYKGQEKAFKAVPTVEESASIIENSFQLMSGLLASKNKIYIENNEQSKELWTKQRLSILAGSAQFKEAVAVPWDSEKQDYLLHYLARVLQVREHGQAFWGPPPQQQQQPQQPQQPTDNSIEWLKLFLWSEMRLPIINPKQVPQLYCEKNIYLPMRNTIYKEDIEALRLHSNMSFNQTPEEKVVIISKDDTASKVIEQYYETNTNLLPVVIDSTMDPSVIAKHFNTCKAVITYNSNTYHLWMCQPGITVIEFQEDIKPSLEAANLSEVAGLKHYILPLTKSIATKRQQDIIQGLKSVVFEDAQTTETTQPHKPNQPTPSLKFETLFSLAAASAAKTQDVHQDSHKGL